MYYFDIKLRVFLHSSIHKEVSDSNNIDTSKYICITEEQYSEFLAKRSSDYGIYSKNGEVLITSIKNPSRWHELDNDGNWFITDENSAEKHKFELEEELKAKQHEYIQLREDIIFNYIMDRTDEMNMLKARVIPLENRIHELKEARDYICKNNMHLSNLNY